MERKHALLAISLVLFGVFGRYVLVSLSLQPFPNFEIVMLVSFLSVMLLRSSYAFVIPLVGIIGSDLLLGNSLFAESWMVQTLFFTYSGFAIAALVLLFARSKFKKSLEIRNVVAVGSAGVAITLLFDLWTNTGWWFLFYPLNLENYIAVLMAGLPFMAYHLLSTLFTFLLVGLPLLTIVDRKCEDLEFRDVPSRRQFIVYAAVCVLLVCVAIW